MSPSPPRNIIVLLLCAVLTITGCTKPDRSEEATALSDELQDLAISDMDKALARVDSAEEAGVFTAMRANTVKACIYENADRRQLAAYYAEKAIATEAGHAICTSADSSDYCSARWILADNAYDSGEYGKSLALAKDILAFVGDGTSPRAVAMKCRALSQMADCESELNHISEAERLFLQSIDIMMESTKQATSYSDVDPLFYSLLALNDLYLDNKMPERALPLMAKMDTALNRLTQCPDNADWVVQMRRNNMTISKAMAYAANGQREQAEAEEQRQLEAQPEEKLTQNQLLYRRLCELMKQSDVYTDADTNHETLARLLGTNYQYIYAALRECADTTPADFLNLHRIRHAAKLLSTTDDPVGLIIEMSGITNRSTFNRLFREHYSMSPSEYRKAAKQS